MRPLLGGPGRGGSKKPSLSRFPQLEGPLMGSPCALVAILHVEQEGKEQERGRRRGREKRRRRKKNAAEGRISEANGCGQGVWPMAQLWEKRGEGNKEGKIRKRGQWKRGPREFSLAQVTVELHRTAWGDACHSDPNRFLRAPGGRRRQ